MQQIIRLVERVEQRPTIDVRAYRMQAERGNDAEIASAAAQPPEKLGVDAGAGAHQAPIRRHQVSRQQVIDGQPVFAHQPAYPAPQGKTGDSGGRNQPTGSGQASRLGGRIELAPGQAWLSGHRARRSIDFDAFHHRQIDHHTPVASAKAGHVVPPTPHRHEQIVFTYEPDRLHHVGFIGAANDKTGMAVDHPIPDFASFFVFLIFGVDKVSVQRGF